MKRSYSVPGLCTAARKQFCYDIQDGCLYLADKHGTFGLKTKDLSLLEELQRRPAVTLELRSPARALQAILDNSNLDTVRDTGIFIPKNKSLCRVLRVSGEIDDQIILVNDALLAPFNPALVLGSGRRNPVILICHDCLAVVMPVNDTREKLTAQLLALDETLNG